jgi:hypothetical protein
MTSTRDYFEHRVVFRANLRYALITRRIRMSCGSVYAVKGRKYAGWFL